MAYKQFILQFTHPLILYNASQAHHNQLVFSIIQALTEGYLLDGQISPGCVTVI